jgi:hypothetical protein
MRIHGAEPAWIPRVKTHPDGPARWAVRPVSYDFKKIATQSPGSALGPWKRLPDGAAMSVPGEPIVRHLIHAQSEG